MKIEAEISDGHRVHDGTDMRHITCSLRGLFLKYRLAWLFCLAWGGSWSFPAYSAADGTPVKTFEVETVSDVSYCEGDDKPKHKLDLYLPKGQKDFPVLFFVHGGGWRSGDKNYFGVYSNLGTFFARHGVGTVVINYRLSPEVSHPEHIKDVARAFAWTFKNIAKYGGLPNEIFACGHSAGGHLVSLLATDGSYLKAEGLAPDAIKGVLSISGVYSLPDGFFQAVFGKDSDQRKQAFPLNHVHSGLPPFLLLYADRDFPGCDKMSEEFAKAIRDAKGEVETQEIKKSNHYNIILSASLDDDPVSGTLLHFVMTHLASVDNEAKASNAQAGASK
jgi:acetyl esterase/lipase